MRKLFGSSNSYFRIVAYSPSTRKVRHSLMSAICKMKTILDLDDDQPTCVVQPTPLEVIVTEHPQNTVTFNEEQISVHTNVPESESESD